MNDWRISRIKIHNFKGFENLDFQIPNSKAVVLGGKNGYGKTSLFDAVELVLTGNIARYQSYKVDYQDLRYRLNDIELPLVYDKKIPELQVDLYISQIDIDNESRSYILTRKSLVRDMKNPVDFSVFKTLYYRNEEDDDMKILLSEDIKKLGLFSLIEYFQSINYIS